MGSPKKNFNKGYQTVKNDFQDAVGNLSEKQHNGTKCNNAIFITVLFCALCRIQSLFAACRNLAGSPDDRTIAATILKKLYVQCTRNSAHIATVIVHPSVTYHR